MTNGGYWRPGRLRRSSDVHSQGSLDSTFGTEEVPKLEGRCRLWVRLTQGEEVVEDAGVQACCHDQAKLLGLLSTATGRNRPDFTVDEVDSDECLRRFLEECAEEAREIEEKEQARRRARRKAEREREGREATAEEPEEDEA